MEKNSFSFMEDRVQNEAFGGHLMISLMGLDNALHCVNWGKASLFLFFLIGSMCEKFSNWTMQDWRNLRFGYYSLENFELNNARLCGNNLSLFCATKTDFGTCADSLGSQSHRHKVTLENLAHRKAWVVVSIFNMFFRSPNSYKKLWFFFFLFAYKQRDFWLMS